MSTSTGQDALFRELSGPTSLKALGASLRTGVGAALALALIDVIVLMSFNPGGVIAQNPNVQQLVQSGLSANGMDFFQLLIFTMVMGVSGSASLHLSAMGVSLGHAFNSHLWLPVGPSGVALLLGTAFGAYLLAKKYNIHFQWLGAAGALVVGLVSGLIYILLPSLAPLTLNASMSALGGEASLHGASARTFCMAFLLAALGSLAGYALAQFAPDGGNVFTSAWRWAHRTRGFVRTIVESIAIYGAVFTALSLVLLVVIAFESKSAAPLLLVFILLPCLPLMLFTFASGGGVNAKMSGSGTDTLNLSVFNTSLNMPIWIFLLFFVTFLLSTFYIALRLSVRNMYDPEYAQWKHAWKSPLSIAVLWGLVSLLVANLSVSFTTSQTDNKLIRLLNGFEGSGGGAHEHAAASWVMSPVGWFFIIAACWAFLIEALALSAGKYLVVSLPLLWRFLVGGSVHQTPQTVIDHVLASGVRMKENNSDNHENSGSPGKPGNDQTWRVPESTGGAIDSNTLDGPSGSSGGLSSTTAFTNAPANEWRSQEQTPNFSSADEKSTKLSPTYQMGKTDGETETAGSRGTTSSPRQTESLSTSQASSRLTHNSVFAPVQAPSAQSVRRMTAQQKRITILSVIIAGFIIVAGIAYGVLSSTIFSAKTLANQYLSAIAYGQFEQANLIADPQVESTKSVLLTDKAAKEAIGRITNQRVTKSSRNSDGSQQIDVTYTLAGRTFNDSLTLAPSGAKFVLFRNWTITTPLVKQISINSPDVVHSLLVNGINVTGRNSITTSDGEKFVLKVYPGTYKVTTAQSAYLHGQEVSVQAGGVQSKPVSLEVRATRKLTAGINDAIKEKLDKCARSKSATPEGCPISFEDYGYSFFKSSSDYRNFAWNITKYPKVESTGLIGGSFQTSDGTAKVTYEKSSSDNWEPEDYTSHFSISGTFAIGAKDKLEVSFTQESD